MSIPQFLVNVIFILIIYSAFINRSINFDVLYEPSRDDIILNSQTIPKQYGMESTKYVEECGILISNVPFYMKRIEEKEYVSRSQHLVFTKLLSKNDRDGSSEYSFEYSKW